MMDCPIPGFRYALEASMGKIKQPLRIDISFTEKVIPEEIEYEYKLFLEDRKIGLLAYSIYTVFSEKIEAILSKNVQSTRMKDFNDIVLLGTKYTDSVSFPKLKDSIFKTFEARNHLDLLTNANEIMEKVINSQEMEKQWELYKRKENMPISYSWHEVGLYTSNFILKILNS